MIKLRVYRLDEKTSQKINNFWAWEELEKILQSFLYTDDEVEVVVRTKVLRNEGEHL